VGNAFDVKVLLQKTGVLAFLKNYFYFLLSAGLQGLCGILKLFGLAFL